MRMVDIIEKKRNGMELSKEEIRFMLEGYTKNTIPDYQMSAFLMAVYFQGMTETEQTEFTMAMVDSGDRVDLSAIHGIKVDKHSTGGVGDTTTLVLAPLVSSVGVPVAKMSGRGLGHTGGTIDKLESIHGFHVEITNQQFIDLVNKNNIAVIGQSHNLTPADKKLYSLRDVTATVDSIPLIASSIMSKKIAAGADAIVLDVKTGAGAFMKSLEEAKKLAKSMVNIGNRVGRKTLAVLSDMNQPLGFAIGNALEVREAIDTLKGKGPKDLQELCLTLGSYMVYFAEKAPSVEKAREQLEASIQSGRALQQLKTFISAQGGDPALIDQPNLLPQAKYRYELKAKKEGWLETIKADQIGKAAMIVGAGRTTKESTIDLAVGIVLRKKIGDFVKKGESLLTIHSNTENIDEIKKLLYESIHINEKEVLAPPLIYGIIS